jgi:hypothetical protein
LSSAAERCVPGAAGAFQDAGVPTVLVAAQWLLPLLAHSLPPPALYRLWDLVFLEGNSTPMLGACLTIMRGAHADALSDFESAMRVQADGASHCFDAQPFIEHVMGYTSLFASNERRLGDSQITLGLDPGAGRWSSLQTAASFTTMFTTRLPHLSYEANTINGVSNFLDRWQLYRVAKPWADEMEKENPQHGSAASLSQRGVAAAIVTLLPGLARSGGCSIVRGRLVSAMTTTHGGVPLDRWLGAIAALHPACGLGGHSRTRADLLWRMCGGACH